MGQRAIVMAKTSFFEKLPMAYLPKIEDAPGVQRGRPVRLHDRASGATAGPRTRFRSAPPTPTRFAVYAEAKIPPAEAAEWKDDPTGCVIGPILAKQVRLEARDSGSS